MLQRTSALRGNHSHLKNGQGVFIVISSIFPDSLVLALCTAKALFQKNSLIRQGGRQERKAHPLWTPWNLSIMLNPSKLPLSAPKSDVIHDRESFSLCSWTLETQQESTAYQQHLPSASSSMQLSDQKFRKKFLNEWNYGCLTRRNYKKLPFSTTQKIHKSSVGAKKKPYAETKCEIYGGYSTRKKLIWNMSQAAQLERAEWAKGSQESSMCTEKRKITHAKFSATFEIFSAPNKAQKQI